MSSAEKLAYQREWYARRCESDPNYRKRLAAQKRARTPKKNRPSYSRREQHLYKLEHRYGLERDGLRKMFENQEGLCAICSRLMEMPGDGGQNRANKACVDHCHDTGRIRGLLCMTCNAGIGQLRDSKRLLLNAVQYLENS